MKVKILSFKRREWQKEGRSGVMIEAHAVGQMEGEADASVFTFLVPKPYHEAITKGTMKPGDYVLGVSLFIDRSGELSARIQTVEAPAAARLAA